MHTTTMMIKGIHRYTFEKYSTYKGIGYGISINSGPFNVGGYEWVVLVYPYGVPCGNDEYREVDVYVGLFVGLRSKSNGVPICLKITLLDQSGERNHRTCDGFGQVEYITTNGRQGYPRFIERDVLEKSSYLKDDCLKIECVISIMLPEKVTTKTIAPKRDGIRVNLLSMLESGEGSDVVFYVRGEKFSAHRVIVSARSSVFEHMFAGRLVSDPEIVVITGVEPQVFKALLHFIYTDTLPTDEKCLEDGYAFGPSVFSTFAAKLLAAANEYNVRRLRSICGSYIWRSISLHRFAETLCLAEQYNASALKDLCFKYAADNYADLVELDCFSYLRKNCPDLLREMDNFLPKGESRRKDFCRERL